MVAYNGRSNSAEERPQAAKLKQISEQVNDQITASVLQLMAFDEWSHNEPWEEKLETRVFVVQAASR